jgi:hypothetical protein
VSEFNESYHVRSVQQRGVDLLRAAGANGFVYPPASGWVTVLADGEPLRFDARLLPANQSGLLYYWCADAQGWGFVACWDGRIVSRYERTWDGDIRLGDAELHLPALSEWLRRAGVKADLERSLPEILYPAEASEFSLSPAHRFAEIAGLKNYRWLSYDCVANQFDEDNSSFRGVVAVRRDGSVIARSEATAASDIPLIQPDADTLIPALFYGDASSARKAWKKVASIGWKAGDWGDTLTALEMTRVDALPGGITLSVAWGVPAARESLWRVYLAPDVLQACAIDEKRFDPLDVMDRLDNLMLTGMDHFWFALGLLRYGSGGISLGWPRRVPDKDVFAKFFERFIHWLPEFEAVAPRIRDNTGVHPFDPMWSSQILIAAQCAGYDIRPLVSASGCPKDLTAALLRSGLVEAAGRRFRPRIQPLR